MRPSASFVRRSPASRAARPSKPGASKRRAVSRLVQPPYWDQTAAAAQHMADTSQQARVAADQGVAAVQQTVAGIADIETVVRQLEMKVEDFSKLGERIGQVALGVDVTDPNSVSQPVQRIEAERSWR
jgi:hypothetical protein